ncbi:MAG TPA: TerB family tellurite resistance protein, partial [Polyangiaceae bacterium]|nr:TerB family tellurite resistance protein [Polyangiaceae bacterium]
MTLLFALFGLFYGGVRGMLLGAVVGFVLSRITQRSTQRDVLRVQDQFIESTFAVVGALCKADGVVTRDEIQFTEGLFDRLHLTLDQQSRAKDAFRRGKEADFDLDAEVDAFAHAARGNHALFSMFLRVQLMVVMADGSVHPAEHEMLLRVAHRLQLSPFEIAQIEAVLRMASRGPSGAAGAGQARAS